MIISEILSNNIAVVWKNGIILYRLKNELLVVHGLRSGCTNRLTTIFINRRQTFDIDWMKLPVPIIIVVKRAYCYACTTAWTGNHTLLFRLWFDVIVGAGVGNLFVQERNGFLKVTKPFFISSRILQYHNNNGVYSVGLKIFNTHFVFIITRKNRTYEIVRLNTILFWPEIKCTVFAPVLWNFLYRGLTYKNCFYGPLRSRR